MYRMTQPMTLTTVDDGFTHNPFKSECLSDALEQQCCRNVEMNPEHFDRKVEAGGAGFTFVNVEEMGTGRSIGQCVRFLDVDNMPKEPEISGHIYI